MNKLTYLLLGAIATLVAVTACDDSKSYADRLVDENKAVNAYLSNHRVINKIPEDTIFEEGEDAPYYRLDPEGNLYMQVLYSGDRKNNMATDDQLLCFRFMRTNLLYLYKYNDTIQEGNADDMNNNTTMFRFNNTTLSSTTQYGTGIQTPLNYLGIDCRVNLIVKSQEGFNSEIANVTPYKYNLRYFQPLSN